MLRWTSMGRAPAVVGLGLWFYTVFGRGGATPVDSPGERPYCERRPRLAGSAGVLKSKAERAVVPDQTHPDCAVHCCRGLRSQARQDPPQVLASGIRPLNVSGSGQRVAVPDLV